MSVHETSEPTMVELTIPRTHNCDVYNGHGWLRVAGKDASAAKRVRHSSDEHITFLEERATQPPAATQTPPPVATPNSSTLSEHKGV